jgi:hypothetical protein
MAKTVSSEEALENLLDLKKKDVKTDQYPMSIGEIVGMYQQGELILRPQYQRYFRWSDEQKSKLIESILIGLPLPSFFMAQDESGKLGGADPKSTAAKRNYSTRAATIRSINA